VRGETEEIFGFPCGIGENVKKNITTELEDGGPSGPHSGEKGKRDQNRVIKR